MGILTAIFIVGGFSLVFLLYNIEPRGYYWGRIRGYSQGFNNPAKNQEMIRQDIERAREEVLVASCTAEASYWTKDTVDLIRERASQRTKPVTYTFLIGPEYQNDLLFEAAKQNDRISIRQLDRDPPYDFRIIDRNSTYVSGHGDRRFLRTFGNRDAFEELMITFEVLWKYRRSA